MVEAESLQLNQHNESSRNILKLDRSGTESLSAHLIQSPLIVTRPTVLLIIFIKNATNGRRKQLSTADG